MTTARFTLGIPSQEVLFLSLSTLQSRANTVGSIRAEINSLSNQVKLYLVWG